MNEAQLRKECSLEPNQLINTSLGLMDILMVKDGMVTLSVLASGNTIVEPVESVITKLTAASLGQKHLGTSDEVSMLS